MIKLLGIGDLFIPQKHIKKGFNKLQKYGVKIQTVDWELDGYDELQEINQLIEQHGSDYYEVPVEIIEAAVDADIIITQFCPVNKAMIDHCKNLKIIGILRGGYENVNTDYADNKDILMYNTPGRNSDAVADFTIGMLLSECRNIARSHSALKNGNWKREFVNADYVPDLPGKTVGIIGLGEIGRKLAKRLDGFDVKILGYDPYLSNDISGIEKVSLKELMKKSDFVTIHARATEDNRNLIDKEMIDLMKPTSYLINTARPGLIAEDELYEALKKRKISGAALDVFEKEPPGRDYPLIRLDNVTVTPHLAGGTTDAFFKSPEKLAVEMNKLWEDNPSDHIINKDNFNKVKEELTGNNI